MKFCPECGNDIEGKKFCSECGYKVDLQSNITTEGTEKNSHFEKELLRFSTFMFGMENKKASVGGKFDVTIPKENYTLTNERLIIDKQGVVSKKREEIELYLIKDINVKQGLKEKVLKIGDIEIISLDNSTPIVVLKRIQQPHDIKESIRLAMREIKKDMNVSYRQEL